MFLLIKSASWNQLVFSAVKSFEPFHLQGKLIRKISQISDWRSYLVTSSGHQAVHYIKWVVARALQHKPGWHNIILVFASKEIKNFLFF